MQSRRGVIREYSSSKDAILVVYVSMGNVCDCLRPTEEFNFTLSCCNNNSIDITDSQDAETTDSTSSVSGHDGDGL